jgi:hypothetical protein
MQRTEWAGLTARAGHRNEPLHPVPSIGTASVPPRHVSRMLLG